MAAGNPAEQISGMQPEYLTTNRSNPNAVTFSRVQLEALEKLFPEQHHGSGMTEAEIRHSLGQRSVVAYIRSKV